MRDGQELELEESVEAQVANGSSQWCVVHDDAMAALRKIPPIERCAVVTDPPYTAAGGSTNGRVSSADSQFFLYWFRDIWREVSRICGDGSCGFVFCDWKTLALVSEGVSTPGATSMAYNGGTDWRVSQALVWDRESIGMGSPFRNSYEMIAFSRGPRWKSGISRDIPTVIRHRWPYVARDNHGAEKPVELTQRLVEWSNADVILDPFCGSGTTGVAAIRAGKRFIGIEQDARHVAVAAKRISSELGRMTNGA